MVDLQRIKKVIKWLIFSGFAENETEMAQKLGYTKSSFSQIINGRVPLSDRFIDKLCDADRNINKVWIVKNEGNMLLRNNLTHEDNSVHVSLSEREMLLREQLAEKNKEIKELSRELGALHHELELCKKNITELHAALPKLVTSNMLEREVPPQPYPTLITQAENMHDTKHNATSKTLTA